MLRRKIKRTTKQYIIVALICTVVMGGAAAATAAMVTGQVKDKYSALLADAYKEMEDNKRTIYIAAREIAVGDVITKENVKQKTVYATQPADIYMTSDDIGKVAMMEIMSGTQLIKGMLLEQNISSELREIEYNVINISSNIAVKDTIDVRIVYPNGENYVVLSKKVLKDYTPETAACILWLNEEELLMMSAAIVDAGIYSGSSLMVTKYIEAGIQKPSIANYTPSLSILSLLENDPNILNWASQELSKEVRKALENRLANSLVSDVTKINWDINPNIQARVPKKNDQEESEDQRNSDSESGMLQEGGTAKGNEYFYYAEEEEAKEDDMEYGE